MDCLLKKLARLYLKQVSVQSMNLNSKAINRLGLLVCCILFAGCDLDLSRFSPARFYKTQESANSKSDVMTYKIRQPETLKQNCITNGMKENEAVKVLGKPKGTVLIGSRRFLVYEGGQVDITDGFVTNLASRFITDVQAAREKAAQWTSFELQQKAKGLVLCDGSWVTPEERLQLIAEKEQHATQMRQKAQEQIRNQDTWDRMSQAAADCDRNGIPINYSEFIVRGKITVVEFYLKNSPNMSPHLDELANNDRDIVLKRIDIMNWGSPLAKKYKVRFLPKVLVFDHRGRLVSPPTSSFSSVYEIIKAAETREY